MAFCQKTRHFGKFTAFDKNHFFRDYLLSLSMAPNSKQVGLLKLNYTGWAKKSKPDNFCNNFVYCHPIFIIFGTYTLQEICNHRMYTCCHWGI